MKLTQPCGLAVSQRGDMMEISQQVLEYLKVLLSWPVITGVCVFFFIRTFKKPIENFIQRLTRGNFYGVAVEAIPQSQSTETVSDIGALSLSDPERYVAEHPKETVGELEELRTKFQCERVFNIIYGSQIRLLDHLKDKGQMGEHYNNLIRFYREFLQKSNLTTINMDTYLSFLESMKLVEATTIGNSKAFKLGPFGEKFLSYIKAEYDPFFKGKDF
jgi:hypothetical protein